MRNTTDSVMIIGQLDWLGIAVKTFSLSLPFLPLKPAYRKNKKIKNKLLFTLPCSYEAKIQCGSLKTGRKEVLK